MWSKCVTNYYNKMVVHSLTCCCCCCCCCCRAGRTGRMGRPGTVLNIIPGQCRDALLRTLSRLHIEPQVTHWQQQQQQQQQQLGLVT
jgi:hypothetical protein